jgi:hypothetical protein
VDQTLAAVLGTSTLLVAITGALLGLRSIILPVWKRFKAFMDAWDAFMRDWAGEPARKGRSRVPGVMERLNKLDGELSHNGGSSIKDAVKRIETKLVEIDERLEEGNRRFEKIEKSQK